MRIVLVGYGRMGREVELVARSRGHEISGVFDINRQVSLQAMPRCDAVIDFSTASVVPQTIRVAAAAGVPVVEGTTGWQESAEEVRAIPGLTMIYSPNFSPGVYWFARLAELAAELFSTTGEYDSWVHEWHHSGKADSPSGTALRLAEVILRRMPRKDSVLAETSHGRIAPEQLHVTSTRAGRIPGTHEVGFDSPWDTVTLRHQAAGREAFAYGAVRAAEWIQGRRGIFSMDDLMAGLAERS